MRTSKESVGLLTGSIRGLSAAMRNMGIAVTAASAISGAAMLTLSRRAERVNAAFREVNSISSEVTDTQEEYGDLVSELNTEFGLQASRLDVIDGLYQSVSAGVEEGAEAQREFLSTAADLAVVGLVDLESSVDVLSTAINAYGEDTEFAEEAAGALFQTVQFGKVTLDELAPVMGRITALGAEMDVTIQELGASMAVLTRTGFEARVAATGLRAIIRSFMRPSEQMQEILRDIALDQDLFAESMGESSDAVRNLAEDYRNATEELRSLEEAQKDTRREISEQSLVIQEARLLQAAIERDAREEAEETIRSQEVLGSSYEELEDLIDDYAFSVQDLRVAETQLNLDIEETKERAEDAKNEFAEMVATSGDLEGGIGQLVLENQGFVDTLVELRKRSDEQGIAFDELFPRTRALQGALALAGEDGSLLLDIFNDMRSEGFDAADAWEKHEDVLSENFDSMEEFIDAAEEMEDFDLEEAADEMRGPQEDMRNAMSELAEAAEDLGEVFTEEVTEAISNFAGAIERIVDRADDMEESARENIGRFTVLATSIGLVLGPLLLLGGQIALIASAMGIGLIPFLAIAGSLFGIFAASLQTAVSGGEDAQGMFSQMEDTFSSIIGFVMRLWGLFRRNIVPVLIDLGEVAFRIFSMIGENVADMLDMTQPGPDAFQRITWAVRDTIEAFTEFIEENEDLIVELVTLAVDVIINDVIPAIVEFGKGIAAVLGDVDWSKFVWIAGIIFGIVSVVAPLVQWIGEWMQRNSELIGTLITWGAIIGGVLLTVAKLAGIITLIVAKIAPFIKLVVAIASAKGIMAGAIAAVVGIGTKLAAIFPGLAKGIMLVVKGAALLIKGIMAVVAIFGAKLIIIGVIIAAVLGLIAAIWIARDEIVDAFTEIKDMVVEILETLWDFMTGEISWEEAGEKIVESIIKGIKNTLGALKTAAKKVYNAIAGVMPGLDPIGGGEGGASSKQDDPEKAGEETAEGYETGLSDYDMAPDMDTSFDQEETFNTEDFEYKAPEDVGGYNTSDVDTTSNGTGGNEVIVEEGAIKVGPFHGLADEEVVEKVDEEVDQSMEQLVEDLRAKGVGGE